MKILISYILLFSFYNINAQFVTTWQTSSANESITIPTFSGETYNYSVDWGDGNTDAGITGDATHTYVTSGNYSVSITGSFPRIFFNDTGDKEKIISIDQWGNQVWSSMYKAFFGCSNLNGSASDVPNLSNVTDMKSMFSRASSFNQDIGDWDVSNVTDIYRLFYYAESFNQDIGDWDVSNVTIMSSVFSGAESFNQDIGDWDVSNVTEMYGLFGGASSFNQDIGDWDVSNVTTMLDLFYEASSFNQDIGDWDVSKVTNMYGMFYDTEVFNQDIGDWDVSSVENMNYTFDNAVSFNQDIGDWDVSNVKTMVCMFYFANSFNQDIGDWDVSTVSDMGSLFKGASSFNQDIGDWDVSKVTDMAYMFEFATSFDQDISDWDVSSVYDMSEMFDDVTLSTANYDALLIGWENNGVQDNVSFSGGNSKYCDGSVARTKLINNHGWSISDGGEGCPPGPDDFVTTWTTNSYDESITIPTNSDYSYNYTVKWGDGSSDSSQTGDATHTYTSAGNHTVIITGDFPSIYFNNSGDKEKIISIDQWGTQVWSNMNNVFYGCSNLVGNASDIPDLSIVSNMNSMFEGASSFNQDIGDWDVSNVTNMQYIFYEANSFNQDISNWDVSNVYNMRGLFGYANTFNQPLNWDVSSVTNMNSMFDGASSFDQDISGWNVHLVTNMDRMFDGASSFNQDIGDWDVSNVTTMFKMFEGANSFNQNIENWDVSNVTFMNDMFNDITLSTENYDALLIAWNKLNLKPNVTFSGGNSNYCTGSCARQNMIDNDGWTITDGDEETGCQPLTANASATDETGNNYNDGEATCSPSGGTSPYTFSWNNGETTQTIIGLSPGNYTITVSDDGSCTSEETVTVNEYTCPTITPNATATDETGNNYNDGEATCSPSGGTSPYTFSWNNGETTQTIINLAPDNYNVTVTDSKACTADQTVTVNEYICPTIEVNASSTDETGNNTNDGTATCSPSGGTYPYTFSWSNGETTQTIIDLAPGNYTVTVTDGKDCTSEETVSIAEFGCEPLTIEIIKENMSCYQECNGFLTVDGVVNGEEPFTYEWSNGETTQTIDNLCANDYSVTVTDVNNCSISETYSITEPDELFANASSTDETGGGLNDGTASANPYGGSSPYEYEYEWNNGEITQTISGLEPGDYTVTVTDYNDCTAEQTVSVEEYSCPTFTIESSQTNVSCYGSCNGNLSITEVINGESPFTYLWNNGANTSSITNLCIGDFSVTITDKNNCTGTKEFTITQPTETLKANASSTDETSNGANDGTATCVPTGGTSPYSYEWSNGATTQSISNLAPNSYTVTVTDANGCTSIESVTVAQYGCQSLMILSTQNNISCFSDCNGNIEINSIENGSAPFTYSWNNGATTSSISDLCSGSYSVTIVDNNNCSVFGAFNITQPTQLLANTSSTNETNVDANDGTAKAIPTGGISPYKYLWSNGQNTQSISGLSPGEYTVIVTDAYDCTVGDTVIIEEFYCPQLVINTQISEITCYGECDGAIAVSGVDNAVLPLKYKWNNGTSTLFINKLCADKYTLTVTDANNCSIVDTFVLTQPDEIVITIDSSADVRLDPLGFIAVSSNGNHIYKWTGPNEFSSQQQDIKNLSDPGCYTLVVTDTINGCSKDSIICLADYTGILEQDLLNSNIKIYPNPVSDIFTVDFTEVKNKKGEITIYDSSGKQFLNIYKPATERLINIDSKSLQSGLYLIKIKLEEGVIYKRLVVGR